MTETQAIEAISAQFLAAWPAASGSVPFAMANEQRLAVDTFAQLQFLPGMRQRLTQGGVVRYQQHVWIVVQIWIPSNTGVASSAALHDSARTVFEKQSLAVGNEAVTIDAGMPRAIGKIDGRWNVDGVQFSAYWFESR